MSEISQEQPKSTENVDIKNNKNKTNSTIEDVLRQKIPDDQVKKSTCLTL